ncbi:MAG: hypothetical protein ACXVH3_29730 [Solirubrobacteraceae bacterium]
MGTEVLAGRYFPVRAPVEGVPEIGGRLSALGFAVADDGTPPERDVIARGNDAHGEFDRRVRAEGVTQSLSKAGCAAIRSGSALTPRDSAPQSFGPYRGFGAS